nr:DUF2515 domain-containing protein [Bacillus marasmi]
MNSLQTLTKDELQLVERINEETQRLNKNNLTRTKAYLDFYKKHPEIHWAFLGHMVSRNGGWNMTDLQGDFLSVLLNDKERHLFFSFLERGNWLIFQDAYPQFLLYEASIQKKRPLFHLLSHFRVSIFMETIWNHFFVHHNRYMLTMALVVNEQSYLEDRVIQHPHYKTSVLNTMQFKLQELFSFTHILFPYGNGGKIELMGKTLPQFESLEKRILLGKSLYRLLFRQNKVLDKVYQWALSKPHTGSRCDYWPKLFSVVKEGAPSKLYKLRRLNGCRLKAGMPRIYSPLLQYAWKDVHHVPAETGDWFKDVNIIEYLIEDNEKISGEIKNEYCQTLEKLEIAVIAKKVITIWS